MGCDIHMYVEYKKKFYKAKDNFEERWVHGDYFKPNPHFDPNDATDDEMERMDLYGGRNYGLFATLAGVRDYTDSIIPVSEPKGVPDDCTKYVKKQEEDWDGDGHSHSWLTLKEIREYQAKSPSLPRTGLLDPTSLKEFDEKGTFPTSWCQGTNQEGYERREWTEPNDTLVPLIKLMEYRCKELFQYDWEEYKSENDNNIRIVFWFDN